MPCIKWLQSPDLQTLKMADQAEPFPHFTDIFLHAHFDVENAKFVQLTHLPCFVKKMTYNVRFGYSISFTMKQQKSIINS